MVELYWIGGVVGGLIAGLCIVGVLVAPRPLEPMFTLAGVLAFGAAGWCTSQVGVLSSRLEPLIASLLLSVAGLACGYMLGSALLETIFARPAQVALVPDSPTGNNRPVVVLLSPAEPETYSVGHTADEISMLAEQEVLEPGIGVIPFLYASQKTRYRAAGGHSPSRRGVRRIADAVGAALGDGTMVKPAFCTRPDSLAYVISSAIAAGHRRFVVVPFAVAESKEMDAAKRALADLRIEDVGASVHYAPALWSEDRLAEYAASRIITSIADPAETGVVLVTHGEPEYVDGAHGSYTLDETAFANRVRMHLQDTGITDDHIRLACAEWSEPDLPSSVRHLAALGCTRILVAPVCFPVDEVVTILDIPVGSRQARLDPAVNIVILTGWQADPDVTETVTDAARRALEHESGVAS